MNSGNFTGRLTADPEIRRTNDGTAVCSFTLAVKRPMTKDTTDFIDFVAWRQSAEYLNNYAHKGDLIAVTGYIQVRNWKDKENRNRKSTEVVAQSLEICASKRADQAGNYTAKRENGQYGATGGQQGTYGVYAEYDPIEGDDAQLPF